MERDVQTSYALFNILAHTYFTLRAIASNACTSLADGAFIDFLLCTPLGYVYPALKRPDLDGLALYWWSVTQQLSLRVRVITPCLMHLRVSTCMALEGVVTVVVVGPTTHAHPEPISHHLLPNDHARADQGVDGWSG